MSSPQLSLHQDAEACDQPFRDSSIRSEVWQIADRIFSGGIRLIDFGCGTGEDAIHFARRGISVTAVDISPAMIAQVKLKSGGAVRCEVADMRTCLLEEVFDGVFSNFSTPRAIRSLQCSQINRSVVVFPPLDGRVRRSIRFRVAAAQNVRYRGAISVERVATASPAAPGKHLHMEHVECRSASVLMRKITG